MPDKIFEPGTRTNYQKALEVLDISSRSLGMLWMVRHSPRTLAEYNRLRRITENLKKIIANRLIDGGQMIRWYERERAQREEER